MPAQALTLRLVQAQFSLRYCWLTIGGLNSCRLSCCSTFRGNHDSNGIKRLLKSMQKKKTPDLNSFPGDSLKLRNSARDSSTLICYNIISIFRLGLGVKSSKISPPFIYPPCNNPLDRQIRCHRISKEALK